MATIRRYTTKQARQGVYETFYQHWIGSSGWQSVSGLSKEPEVRYENVQVADTPEINKPMLRIQVRHSGSEMDSFGQDGEGGYQATGVVTIQVFVPLDEEGLLFHDDLVNVARRAFRGRTGVNEYCGIVFREARINEVGPSGRWYVTNVLSDFEYDEEN